MDRRTERLLGGRYCLGPRLGSGSFGEIFQGEDVLTQFKVAIKLEPIKCRSPRLGLEFRIYQHLAGGVGIPRCYFYGSDPSGSYNALVIDLLSSSLDDLITARKQFSTETVLILAWQMLTCIEWLHRRHFVHRDIKPGNFMIGADSSRNQVFLIDFGLSKSFRDPMSGRHIPLTGGKNLTGTARYASINAMRGFEQSRRDDLEAIGYVLIYFLRGALPWQGLPANTQREKLEAILRVKEAVAVDELCDGTPREFAEYLLLVRSLDFTDVPPYAEYRRMFRELFIRHGCIYRNRFEWLGTPAAQREPESPRKRAPSTEFIRKQPAPTRSGLPMLATQRAAPPPAGEGTRAMNMSAMLMTRPRRNPSVLVAVH
jgi:serine/threonine protein kinase